MTHQTREDWLVAAIEELRPMFTVEGHALSEKIRVTCGFPSTATRSGAIGECHASAASKDQHYEVMVSPVLADPARVLDVLIHELCHTLPGCMNHGVTFQHAASSLHLAPSAGKGWKATIQGPGFGAAYADILLSLGAYPHAELSLASRKKQSTRMLKAVCPSCGYTIRLTKTWADKGLPICSQDGAVLKLV